MVCSIYIGVWQAVVTLFVYSEIKCGGNAFGQCMTTPSGLHLVSAGLPEAVWLQMLANGGRTTCSSWGSVSTFSG